MTRASESADQVPVPLAELLTLAAQFEQAGRHEDAARLADHILGVRPQHAAALHIKAAALAALERHAEAAQLLERAVAHGLELPRYHRNLCAVYERLGRLEEGLAAGRRAVALDPTDADAYHNLTVVLARLLHLDGAIDTARTALALDPQRAGAHMALAEALLLRGDLAEGFAQYEWRFRLPGVALPLPQTDRPQWQGAALDEEALLLVADQGFGDGIQFCRYIPWVRTRARRVVIACPKELQPFMRQIAPDVPLFERWADCPPYAAYAMLSGLPRLHGTTLATIPARDCYLAADPARAARWRERLHDLTAPGQRRIGVVWAGRAGHSNDRNRSVPLGRLAPLFECADVTFVAVQKGARLAEVGGYRGNAPLLNLGASIEDFIDTAAILASLDLVVTVDTSVAHLAAALGRPTWILLPFAPDWRWLLDREDSPWYPTVRLFRQPRPGDWHAVAEKVAAALATLARPAAHT